MKHKAPWECGQNAGERENSANLNVQTDSSSSIVYARSRNRIKFGMNDRASERKKKINK